MQPSGATKKALVASGLEHAQLMKRLVTLDTALPLTGIEDAKYGSIKYPTATSVARFKKLCDSHGLDDFMHLFNRFHNY